MSPSAGRRLLYTNGRDFGHHGCLPSTIRVTYVDMETEELCLTSESLNVAADGDVTADDAVPALRLSGRRVLVHLAQQAMSDQDGSG